MDRFSTFVMTILRLLGAGPALAAGLACLPLTAAATGHVSQDDSVSSTPLPFQPQNGPKSQAAQPPAAAGPGQAANSKVASSTAQPQALPKTPAAASADDSNDNTKFLYVLQPQDLLNVKVFEEPDLERDVRVSQNHTIVLPLIGTVDLTNRTVHEAEELITDLYGRDYLVNPQINITVTDYAQRSLNVLGAVNSPGTVVIPPERNLSLVDAIARSGGFSRLANRTKVSLTRKLSNGETKHYTINADQLIDGNTARQWLMQDGDVIYVPESVL